MSRNVRPTKGDASTSTRSGLLLSESGPNLRRTKRPMNHHPSGVPEHGNSSSDVVATSIGDASHDKSDYLSGTTTTTTKRPAHNPQFENTFKMHPEHSFRAQNVEQLTHDVLSERLRDVYYEPNRCKSLTQELAGEIVDRLKTLAYKRYKMVAVVSIGSLRERPGMQFGSRCLWNQQTDSFLSVKYSNGSLFAVAMVYGLYFE